MKINELLDLSSEIRDTLEVERSRRKLGFIEKTHKYSIYDPKKDIITSNLPSVSTIIKKTWCDPFDSLEKSLQMMNGDVLMADELRKKWQKMGDDASSIGSYAHYKLEKYVWELFDINKVVRKPYYNLEHDELLEAQHMLNNGVNMIHNIIKNGFVPLETECVMGSIELGYFGQCDNIWIGVHNNKISLLMTDYKTNKTKNFKEANYNNPMFPPFTKLKDTELSKYYIQQPLYAQLFKDMLKNSIYRDMEFAGFRILHLREEGNSIKIPQWVYKEIQDIYPINKLNI